MISTQAPASEAADRRAPDDVAQRAETAWKRRATKALGLAADAPELLDSVVRGAVADDDAQPGGLFSWARSLF